MGVISKDEALNIAFQKYKESMPPGITTRLTPLEWQWMNSLATRAGITGERIKDYSLSWTLKHLFEEGIGWQIRMEIPLVRKAGMMRENGEHPRIPSEEELRQALGTADAWGPFWEDYAPDIYLGVTSNNPEFVNINSELWPPKYIRLPSGWRDIIKLWMDMIESRTAPGPKPRWLIALCKEIVRTFPLPVDYGQGEIDLLSTAVGIIVRRLTQ